MQKVIFISYSRRDQEFVTRLASDLDRQVAGAWFDQSSIQVGQKWHDEIMEGIRECKAFILVHDVQTLDLRSGSYQENFQKLVDGLVAAGAARIEGYEMPFMRGPEKVGLGTAFRKIPGWALAWSLGWGVFWIIVLLFLFFLLLTQDNMGNEDVIAFLVILLSGMMGGFTGGLLAGVFTMLSLRPNAPSISWKHMSPTIRVWAVSGPLGMFVSGIVTGFWWPWVPSACRAQNQTATILALDSASARSLVTRSAKPWRWCFCSCLFSCSW